MSHGTADALGVADHHRVKLVLPLQKIVIGSWKIKPFSAIHDAEIPLGFLLASGEDNLIYATDTAYIPYRVPELSHILIECNYSKELLRESVLSGAVSSELKRRIMAYHMSLETVLDFLKANDLSQLKEIYLLHLSSTNSDEALFKRSVEELVGDKVKVSIAKEG